ncbi:protein of unknown function [Pararobbsia alpina]
MRNRRRPRSCFNTPDRCIRSRREKQKTREELAFYHGFFASLYRGNSGAGKRNRTPDLRITNALLYRLSYSGDEETRV